MEKTNTITKNEFKKSFVKHYRVGEKVVCTNNMIAEIIEYRNYKDIDVRYEDGYIIEHTTYQSFFQKDTFNKLGYKAKINTHTTSYIN